MTTIRRIDGRTVALTDSETYFEGFHTPGMYQIAKATGADMVLLLAHGKTADDITDDEIREHLKSWLVGANVKGSA